MRKLPKDVRYSSDYALNLGLQSRGLDNLHLNVEADNILSRCDISRLNRHL